MVVLTPSSARKKRIKKYGRVSRKRARFTGNSSALDFQC
jgi:hypothetical protein